LLALFPNQVFFTSQTMTETLFTTLFVLSLVLVVRLLLASKPPRLWHLALVGVALGCASLVRGEAVLLFAVVAPALALRWRSWRTALDYSAVLVLGMALVIGPWTARNLVRMRAPILISSSATEALWVGHHEGADGKIADFSVVGQEYVNLYNPAKEVKTSNEALSEALTFIREHPFQDLQLIPKKLSVLYKADGSGIRWLQLTAPTIDPGEANKLSTLGNDYYRVVLALAILGLPAWFSLRDPGKALLLGVVVYWTLLFGVVFFGDERFHFPLEPIAALWAGASLVAMGRLLLRRRPGRKRAQSY
jgi:4-amino-4-deoxy-L-arabinose transferase-like glycosyltransferase